VEQQQKLRDTMAELLLLGQQALAINASIIGAGNLFLWTTLSKYEDQLKLQDMLEGKFQSIMHQFQGLWAGSLRWSRINSKIHQEDKKEKHK
jgi:hypothetical protein